MKRHLRLLRLDTVRECIKVRRTNLVQAQAPSPAICLCLVDKLSANPCSPFHVVCALLLLLLDPIHEPQTKLDLAGQSLESCRRWCTLWVIWWGFEHSRDLRIGCDCQSNSVKRRTSTRQFFELELVTIC